METNVRFLLVEDSELDADLLASVAKHVEGARLSVVKDGAEAIAYLQGWGEYADRLRFPAPQIILLDWEMPRMSGRQFLVWRREKAPADVSVIPVVIFSGTEDPANVREAFAWGAALFLGKSSSTGVLRRRLQLLVDLWRETDVSMPKGPRSEPEDREGVAESTAKE